MRAGTKGGKIKVTGEHIAVAGANIDASGRAGGGKVLIGGDWAGGKPDTSLVSNQSAKLEDKGDRDRHDGKRRRRDYDRCVGEG